MARRIGLAANTEPLVVGEWTRATSAPADTSEGSLFDSMMMMPDTRTTRLPTTVRPTTPSTQQTLVTTTSTSLFDSTEIFYENFTKPDAGSVIVSEDFKPLLEAINRNSSPLKSKFPAIPDKFMDVIKNHTNTLKSLFSDGSTITTTTTLPSTTVSFPEKSLFSASSQSDSNESTFSISRPSGKIDESLIVPALRRQTRLDVSLEKKSRFGLSRPMIRGVITESDRSSEPPEKTVRYFKNHKYSFLTHSRDEKDLTIEEILEVSRSKKDFEVSQRFKPKYPVYIKKNVAHSISGRNAREQELKIKRLLATNIPFPTGRIFDSGTGKVENLDLDKSRTLFPKARDNDDDDDDDDDDEENENDNLEELNDADENEDKNDSTEESEEDDEDSELEDELESNIVIETDDGFDEESGDVGLGSSYIERQLNDADEHREQYDHEKEEKEDTKNYEDENDEDNDEDGKDVEEEYEEEDEEEDEDGEDEDERDGENNDDVDDEDEDEADADFEDDHEEDVEYEDAGEGENEEETKYGDSISEHDEEKERSLNFNERSNQNGQVSTRNSHQNILFPGPLHYRLIPRYPLPVPHQYYQPVHYHLVPRPYAYINRGQHFYSPFI